MAVTAQLVKELRERTGAGMLDCKKALEATDGNIEKAITWLREKGITKAAKKSDRVAAEGLVGLVTKGNKTVVFEVNSETDFVGISKQFLDLMAIVGETLINNDPKTVEAALQLSVNGESLETVIVHTIATIGEKITLRRFKTLHLQETQSLGVYIHSNQRIVTVLVFDGKIDETIGKQLAMHVSAMRPQFISRDDISADFLASEKAILTTEAKNDPKNVGKPDNILEKMVEGRLNKQLAEISLLDQVFVVNPDQKVSDVIKANDVSVVDMIRYEVGEGIEKEEVDFATEVMAQVRK
ncbi:MAG: elongation factor Ts [Spiroplasma poulsonii]|uniref:Elongation factor Ts n=1 Tax=Spiroplasma poulsonii TaxID=2138 RepID=A0A2P6FCL8_9MOLU|nr:translation elongation factor Ts [Spiroplasma poulsonii]KAF0851530.1 Elongation factor Ts [Spiroplasma poulsonii]MBW1241591.1 elongation factor Ts [Spiroplasma poulsonii]PQM31124.1 Elongation factor Ts [Spiroplasma poulsonii]PWF96126.1 Elongation factor Ts [Spiroplasma poulsonii]PWF98900.1 Elongation factor Ts [Spiroplasma poulsonii]